MVSGLSQAVVTPTLMIRYPEKYGVWNHISQAGMEALGIWPALDRGASFAERYERINTALLTIASEIGDDLWTLDAWRWQIETPGERRPQTAGTPRTNWCPPRHHEEVVPVAPAIPSTVVRVVLASGRQRAPAKP